MDEGSACKEATLCLYLLVRIEFSHARDKETIEVPDRNLIAVLKPNDRCRFHDTGAALQQAADACAGFLGSSQHILVLVNDYTRPTPSAPVLAALDATLRDRDVKYVVCLGTHRPAQPAELDAIFGSEFVGTRRDRIMQHDSRDKSRLFFLGKTSFGNDVWMNRELLWADKVITINSIEPHYFAGYTGGRKGFLPGIAGYDTITRNHNMVTHEGSATFSLKGNPVHEDMTEAAKMLPRPVFSIQLVQRDVKTGTVPPGVRRSGSEGLSPVFADSVATTGLLSISFGDLFKSFDQAAADAHKVFAVPVQEKADIVLSVLGPPSNINFYQAQRAVEFARPVLRNPSVHITVSACHDGIGNDSFIQVFRNCSSPSDILAPPSSLLPPHSSVLGWHKSARLAQIMQTADLYTVMGIDDTVVNSAFMHPYRTAQDALNAAFARLGPDARVYFIPDAGSVVPVLS